MPTTNTRTPSRLALPSVSLSGHPPPVSRPMRIRCGTENSHATNGNHLGSAAGRSTTSRAG
jgi:hypothetical protein